MRMALLSEKTQAMGAAQDAHVRQCRDPSFYFVPRQKMMQIQVRAPGGMFPGPTRRTLCTPNSNIFRVFGSITL